MASQQQYVNLLSPAEPPTKSPRHHRPTNNDMSISHLQRSLRRSLHGIIGQPTTIRQPPVSSGASNKVSTASSEPSTKSTWHHRPVNLPLPAEPSTESNKNGIYNCSHPPIISGAVGMTNNAHLPRNTNRATSLAHAAMQPSHSAHDEDNSNHSWSPRHLLAMRSSHECPPRIRAA